MAKQTCSPILKALADENRWSIVRELLSKPRTVGELVERLEITQYNVSKHLRVLREAGLIDMERDGKHVRSSVADGFRTRLTQNAKVLDLGCCTFRFD